MDILNGPTGRLSTPDPQCSICLDDLTNKCKTNSCMHLFCFACLQQWSNTQQCSSSEPTCPLCKKTFRYIYHSFDDLGIFETYTVPVLDINLSPRLRLRLVVNDSSQSSNNSRSVIVSFLNTDQHTTMRTLQSNALGESDTNHVQLYHHSYLNHPYLTLQRPIIGQGMRIQVYVNNRWALPLPNSADRLRYGTSDFYRNPIQMLRIHSFIAREIVAIRESVRLEGPPILFPENNDIIATHLIMQSLRGCDIRQLYLHDNLRPILNVHAVHFCHELYNFAISPYAISDYDRNVQYTNPLHDREITAPLNQEQSLPFHIIRGINVLNSNNEELQRPNIIEELDSSSTNDSDAEVVSHSFRSTDPLNSACINQSSTSTGIRESLDRPNNSFQSVNGGLSRVSVSSQVKRSRSNPDSSSDDEESNIATQGSQTAHLKSQNVNKKKKNERQ